MAHYTIPFTIPHGLEAAELIKESFALKAKAQRLKVIADSVTGGGATLDAQAYLDLFGLPSGAAGTAFYPLLQTLMACATDAALSPFDQGL